MAVTPPLVFLSYTWANNEALYPSLASQEHIGWVEWLFRVLTQLANRRFEVFKDDRRMAAGAVMDETLRRHLQAAKVFVPVLSNDYLNSPWCLSELGGYIEVGPFLDAGPSQLCSVIPVYLKSVEKVPEHLALVVNQNIKNVDFRRGHDWVHPVLDGSMNPAFRELINQLVDGILQVLNASRATSARPRVDLLGLSKRPPLNRFPSPLESIGRERELEWILNTAGDRMLVGVPGSGKTHLLTRLVDAREHAYFVVDGDLNRLAEEIHKTLPDLLVVDDVRSARGRECLRNCLQLRGHDVGQFELVLSGWGKEDIDNSMLLPSRSILELERLTRDQVLQIIEACGLKGAHRALLAELVTQAEGRPGLAVVLSRVVLDSDLREVALGNVLKRQLLSKFEDRENVPLLAILSLAGDAGMDCDTLARLAATAPATVWKRLTELEMGGVLLPISKGGATALTVRPPVLRGALIREVFTQDEGPTLSLDRFLEELRGEDTVQALVEARRLGAAIPQLERLLSERGANQTTWEMYAWLGPSEAKRTLEGVRGFSRELTLPALHFIPKEAIIHSLVWGIGDTRALHQHPGHPLRVLREWICSAKPGTPEPLRRRQLLFEVASYWIAKGEDLQIGQKACCLALSPVFSSCELDPGAGTTVTISEATLTAQELLELAELWELLAQFLHKKGSFPWSDVLSMVGEWEHPRGFGGVTGEVREALRAGLEKALAALAALPMGLGAGQRLRGLAQRAGIAADFPMDSDFEMLFPATPVERRRERDRDWEAVTQRWLALGPRLAANRLNDLLIEAESAGSGNPNVWMLCLRLAERVDDPGAWCYAFLDHCPHTVACAVFLEAALRQDTAEAVAVRALREPGLGVESRLAVLRRPPSPAILEQVLSDLGGLAEGLHNGALRQEFSDEVLHRLLTHPDGQIRLSVVTGHWLGTDKKPRESLKTDWESALVDAYTEDDMEVFYLGEVLGTIPELAERWLVNALKRDYRYGMVPFHWKELLSKAVGALTLAARENLLDLVKVQSPRTPLEFVESIVGDSAEVYGALLDRADLRSFHLIPLTTLPEGAWKGKARLALDRGYTPEEVASAALALRATSWCGPESHMWAKWAEAFRALLDDSGLESVGQAGHRIAEQSQREAEKREHKEAVYGR